MLFTTLTVIILCRIDACKLNFPEHHTWENIAEVTKSTLDAWNLKIENQVGLTTGNGSNIVKAAKWCRLSCFGHNLHLAVLMVTNGVLKFLEYAARLWVPSVKVGKGSKSLLRHSLT